MTFDEMLVEIGADRQEIMFVLMMVMTPSILYSYFSLKMGIRFRMNPMGLWFHTNRMWIHANPIGLWVHGIPEPLLTVASRIAFLLLVACLVNECVHFGFQHILSFQALEWFAVGIVFPFPTVYGYLQEFSKNKKKKFVIEIRASEYFQLALEKLKSEKSSQSIEHVEIIIMKNNTAWTPEDARAVEQLFRTVGRLLHLQKLDLFTDKLPLHALTAFLEEAQKSNIYHQQQQKKAPLKLQFIFVKLLGSSDDLTNLCNAFRQCNNLLDELVIIYNHAILCLRGSRDGTEKEILEGLAKNEAIVAAILQALQNVPLSKLKIYCTATPKKPQGEQHNLFPDNDSNQKPSPPPLVKNLQAFIQHNKAVTALTVGVFEPFFENETLCHQLIDCLIPTLAESLGDNNVQLTSKLTQLGFTTQCDCLGRRTSLNANDVLKRYHPSLIHMMRHNYNLTKLKYGTEEISATTDPRYAGEPEEEAGDTEEEKRIVQYARRALIFYMSLNANGRKRLLCDPKVTAGDWVDIMIQSKDDLSRFYYWLSMNPSILKQHS